MYNDPKEILIGIILKILSALILSGLNGGGLSTFSTSLGLGLAVFQATGVIVSIGLYEVRLSVGEVEVLDGGVEGTKRLFKRGFRGVAGLVILTDPLVALGFLGTFLVGTQALALT